MSLGGFGRGWRRPDHRIFLETYGKTPIGCHWEWRSSELLPDIVLVKSDADLVRLMRHSRSLAERWLRATNQSLGGPAPWREVIHPDKMLIWTRHASDTADAQAIRWFHQPKDGEPRRDARDLRKSDLAGKMNQVGRIWNRMLPVNETGAHSESTPERQSQAAPAAASLGAALARPGAASARPVPAVAVPGDAWMEHATGPFLESLVLFAQQGLTTSFSQMMDDGARTNFRRLRW
jgi:CRISPR-associated protein Cmr6